VLRKSWFWRLGALLGFGACVYACHVGADAIDTSGNGISSPAAGAVPVCGPGRAGCACDSEGLIASCGEAIGNSGNYLTCALGTSVCQGGVWGACVTKNLVTKSLQKTTLGSGPTRLLQTTITCPGTNSPFCDDPCDPYTFSVVTSDAGDVDSAQTIAVDGGGISINPVCTDLACQVAACPVGSETTLTGTVYDPAGNNPLYNAYVYVPVDPSGALPPFSSGASCDTCAGAGAVPVVADAVTAPDGTFTLKNVPSTDVLPGHAIPLVVQTGKWRRQRMLASVPKCRTVPVAADDSRLPRSQSDGFGGHADIPKMAIATGAQDPLQCLLLKMGIDQSEFQQPGTGTARIDYYVDTGMEFGSGTPVPKSQLVSSLSTLMNYDVVLLPCGGRPATSALGNYPSDDQYADNVAAYANGGGRVFATHYGLTWLAMPSGTSGVGAGLVASATNPATNSANPFIGVANWKIDAQSYTTAIGDIDTTFTKGAAFSTWMVDVGGATTAGDGGVDGGGDGGGDAGPGQIPLSLARQDMTRVNAPATEWIHHDTAPGEPFYFSFDTPLTAGTGDAGAGTCGRVGFADFHVSSTALTDPSGTCATDQDCGFVSTCNAPVTGICAALQCGGAFDCTNGPGDPNQGYTCTVGTTTNTCEPAFCRTGTDCGSGVCQPDAQGLMRCGCSGPAHQAQQCKSGVCLGNNTCAPASQGSCTRDEDCGNSEFCSGSLTGSCEKTCTTDADCGTERCVGGQCQGCLQDSDCQSGNCYGGTPGMCSQAETTFPLGCRQVPMTPQEDALEFMLLDLTSCISTGPAMTSVPPTYNSATFTEDFTSSCPLGTRPVWREFDWVDTIPPSAEIDYSAQTTDPPEDGGPVDWTSPELVSIAKATMSTPAGGTDFQILDTGTTGVFNLASPPVLSRSLLRLTVTLLPTADTKTAPVLQNWDVKADCVPAE
jgi:hypothetical protein